MYQNGFEDDGWCLVVPEYLEERNTAIESIGIVYPIYFYVRMLK